jgi:hypothetical protein
MAPDAEEIIPPFPLLPSAILVPTIPSERHLRRSFQPVFTSRLIPAA